MKLYDALIKEKGGVVEESAPVHPHYKPPHRPLWKRLLWPLITILALAAIFVGGIFMARATIRITARSMPFTLDNSLITVPYDKLSTKDTLHFQAMVMKGSVSREVLGDRTAETYIKATGNVVLFNEYSTKNITLQKGTVLTATSTKKHYTLNTQVVIPGYKTDAGKRTAGVTDPVSVTAQAAGSDYNFDGGDFTVAGYAASQPKIYARSSGPFTGGQSGLVHALSEAAQAETTDTLKQLLTEKLKRQARAQLPDGFVTFPELEFTTYNMNDLVFTNPDIKYPVTLSGTLVVYLFPEEPLEEAVAQEALANAGNKQAAVQYRATDLSALTVESANVLPLDIGQIPNEVDLRISGDGTLRATVDTQKIVNQLVGRSTATFEDIVGQNQNVNEASYAILPFWSPYFPSDTRYFNVIVH